MFRMYTSCKQSSYSKGKLGQHCLDWGRETCGRDISVDQKEKAKGKTVSTFCLTWKSKLLPTDASQVPSGGLLVTKLGYGSA